MLVNTTHKQALKATVALLAVRDECNVTELALAVQDAVVEMGLQVGNMSRLGDISNYALAVRAQGEKASNRKWGEYPSEVKTLVGRLAAHARLQVVA